ncbi:hypothetical protein SDC9_191712 [bioreactor metagenome]|uniref:HTH araC/xylS-type domain-containing protein n=1 Tax=bioreactor metagenome TaxID=1076179 RepID=A0A645HYM8_9ZZZZ
MLDRLVLQSASVREQQALARPLGGLAAQVRRRVLEYIDAHLARSEALTLSQLAQVANLSEFHFARMFRQSMGCTPHGWIALKRLARARDLLGQPRGAPALEMVAAECGYSSASHLARSFRVEMGVTPTQYARARRNT